MHSRHPSERLSELLRRHAPLWLVLLAAVAFRFNNVTDPYTDCFSWRQASTAMMSENFGPGPDESWNILYPRVNWTGRDSGYQGREFQTVSYTVALLRQAVGRHDWLGRAVAASFGVWGVFALYCLVTRAWDRRHGLAAAAVMALLPGAVFIDRSFLPDPGMLALVLTGFWMLMAYLQTDRARYLVLAGLFATLGFATKGPGLAVLLAMGYATVVVLRRRGRLSAARLAAVGGFAVVSIALVAAYLAWARWLGMNHPPYHVAGSGNWLWAQSPSDWVGKGYFLPDLWRQLNTWLWTAPVMALAAIGVLCLPPGRRAVDAAEGGDDTANPAAAPWLFHYWLAGCLVLYALGAHELTENPWNLHVFNVPAAVFAGRALVLLAGSWAALRSSPARFAATAAALVLIAAASHAGLHWMYQPTRAPSREMGLALDRLAGPDDLVVTIPDDIGDPVAIYYSRRRGWVFPPARPNQPWNQLPPDGDEAIALFEDLRGQGAGWFAVAGSQAGDLWANHPRLAAHVERTCDFAEKSGDYVIYRIRRPEGPGGT